MASIEDFLNHRWIDAKTALRELDSDFVRKIESRVRLDSLNLAAPWSANELEREPYRRLRKEWHTLLEACADLTLQIAILEESATVLSEPIHSDTSTVRAGRQALLHFRSWPIHAQALGAHVCSVIDSTTEVYVDNQSRQRELASLYKGCVKEATAHFRERLGTNTYTESGFGAKALLKINFGKA